MKCTKSYKRKNCRGTELRAVLRDNVLYEDGEYVKAGDLLAVDSFIRFSAVKQGISNDSCLMSPDAPLGTAMRGKRDGWTWHDSKNLEDLQQVRQMTAILNYYRTFDLNSIHPNARHFEVLAHIQTNYVSVDGVVSDFNSRKSDKVQTVLPKKGELVLRNSGLLTAAVFEDVVRTMGGAVVSGYVSSAKVNNSPISLIANGADLRKGKLKPFAKYNHATVAAQILRDKAPYEVINSDAPVSAAVIDTSPFDIFNDLSKVNVFGDVQKEEPTSIMMSAEIDLDALDAGDEEVEEDVVAEEVVAIEEEAEPEEVVATEEEVVAEEEAESEESEEFDPSMLDVSNIFAGSTDDFEDEDILVEENDDFASASGSSIFEFVGSKSGGSEAGASESGASESDASESGASEVSDDLDDFI